MLLASVLTGDSTRGDPDYRVAPMVPGTMRRFDSLADDTVSPSIYVVQNPAQAVVSFIVTYTL